LQESAFERGCPLATVALESAPQDHEIRAALANAFTQVPTAVNTVPTPRVTYFL
jgi:TetR/AcrR family transcriptional repressor of lmrAB and yxaGH operons